MADSGLRRGSDGAEKAMAAAVQLGKDGTKIFFYFFFLKQLTSDGAHGGEKEERDCGTGQKEMSRSVSGSCCLRSGAGGSRTLVQTRKPYAFYMLIPTLVFE